ncbi:uncharacterized protein [Haliotis cracherodii]|uniref:uncharacterized protein n=1 Tax=Haliotis cracherodii TaxID=6455 RepID=UPI0039ECB9EC
MASTPALYTLAVLFVTCIVITTHGFSLKGFCASNCARGKGGNVCKCNGFHFAGKRGVPTLDSDLLTDSMGDSKEENFLELDSEGFGVFGYPKDDSRRRTLKNTNSRGNFRALLEKYLAERYSQGGGFGPASNPDSWSEVYRTGN